MSPERKLGWWGFWLWIAVETAHAVPPSVPWQFVQPLDPAKTYLVQLTYFKVPRDRMDRARLFVLIQGVTKQLAASPGLVAYTLHEDEPTARYWTLSIWENAEGLQAFTYGARTPHARVMTLMKDAVERSGFVAWEIRGLENRDVTWRSIVHQAPCGALLEVGPPSEIE